MKKKYYLMLMPILFSFMLFVLSGCRILFPDNSSDPIEPENNMGDTPVELIVDLDNDIGTVVSKSFSFDASQTVKGLSVSPNAEQNNKYSGKFNGVFKGSLELEYLFPSMENSVISGFSGAGYFKFVIQSVKNQNQFYAVIIQPKTMSSVSLNRVYLNQSSICGVYGESEIYDYIEVGTNKKTTTRLAEAASVETYAPKFNLNGSLEKNKLYIVQEDSQLSIHYDLMQENQKTMKSPALISMDNDRFDFSEGYKIYFQSVFDIAQYKFYEDNGNASNLEEGNEVGASEICFTKLNDYSLKYTLIETERENNRYTINGKDLGAEIILPQYGIAAVYNCADYQFYYNEKNGIENSFIGNAISTLEKTLDTDKIGSFKFDIKNNQYQYKVVKSISPEEMVLTENAIARRQTIYANSYTNGLDNTYTGIVVGSEEELLSYSGMFNGIFKGTNVFEYKLNGYSGEGDNFGNFKWIIRSVADPTQTYIVEITQQLEGLNSPYNTRTKGTIIFGYDTKTNTQNYLKDGLTSEGTEKLGKTNNTSSPLFNTSEVVGTEKIYFEVVGESLSIYYQLNDHKTKSTALRSFEKSEFDISQGYTVEFESYWNPELLTYNYLDKYGNKLLPDFTKRSTSVTFLSINDQDFAQEKLPVVTQNSVEKCYINNVEVKSGTNYVMKDSKVVVDTALSNTTLYKNENNSFILNWIDKKNLGNLDTKTSGVKEFSYNDVTFSYTVCDYISAEDLISVNGANKSVESYLCATEYSGVTIGSVNDATAYSGNINCIFKNSTEIEYKFNGTGNGDNYGNFVWKVQSVKNPNQVYYVEISQGVVMANYWQTTRPEIFGYFERPTEVVNGGLKQFYNPKTKTSVSDSKGWGVNTSIDTKAPRFHSDNVATTEKLYFDITEDGLSISYRLFNTFEKSLPIITLNAEQFDISDGYTVSFSSNWDPTYSHTHNGTTDTLKYYKQGNYYELIEETRRSAPITIIALSNITLNGENIMLYEEEGRDMFEDGTIYIPQSTT